MERPAAASAPASVAVKGQSMPACRKPKKGRVITVPGLNLDDDPRNRNWLREWGCKHGERGKAHPETTEPPSEKTGPDEGQAQ